MSGKLRKADRVRLRLLSPEDKRRLEAIADNRGMKLSTALRILQIRFAGNVGAFERDWRTSRKREPGGSGKAMLTSTELAELIEDEPLCRS